MPLGITAILELGTPIVSYCRFSALETAISLAASWRTLCPTIESKTVLANFFLTILGTDP